mmetsp:Transcript_6640/g.17119  ORF Transcript_6640/g.17119 Transcript_6640/m.17119 type:complete len:377 (+) Transcript_6640:677-1807(+)
MVLQDRQVVVPHRQEVLGGGQKAVGQARVVRIVPNRSRETPQHIRLGKVVPDDGVGLEEEPRGVQHREEVVVVVVRHLVRRREDREHEVVELVGRNLKRFDQASIVVHAPRHAGELPLRVVPHGEVVLGDQRHVLPVLLLRDQMQPVHLPHLFEEVEFPLFFCCCCLCCPCCRRRVEVRPHRLLFLLLASAHGHVGLGQGLARGRGAVVADDLRLGLAEVVRHDVVDGVLVGRPPRGLPLRVRLGVLEGLLLVDVADAVVVAVAVPPRAVVPPGERRLLLGARADLRLRLEGLAGPRGGDGHGGGARVAVRRGYQRVRQVRLVVHIAAVPARHGLPRPVHRSPFKLSRVLPTPAAEPQAPTRAARSRHRPTDRPTA